MKRWLIAGLVVVAIGLIAAFVAANTKWEEVTLPSPLKGEAVTNPFYASQRFAEALGATTEWRHTLGALPPDDTVVVLSHWHWDLIQDRRQVLEAWIDGGGRVVFDRTLIGGEEHLESWVGIRREHYADEETTEEDVEAEDEDEAADDEVMMPVADICNDELRNVDARGELLNDGRKYSVCQIDPASHLVTDRDIDWGLASHRGIHALRVKVGRGSVTAINAAPFGNRELLDIDHGELFVAATQLRRGDHVIFVSERDHPSLLALMWIYGAPVVVLVGLILAALLWRGGVRFGPLAATPDLARRSIAEQIRGTGQFTIRLGGGKALHAATVRALHEAANARLAGYAGLAQPERIATIARATGTDAEALAQAINHSGARRAAELAQTIELLETARRKLLDRSVATSSEP